MFPCVHSLLVFFRLGVCVASLVEKSHSSRSAEARPSVSLKPVRFAHSGLLEVTICCSHDSLLNEPIRPPEGDGAIARLGPFASLRVNCENRVIRGFHGEARLSALAAASG